MLLIFHSDKNDSAEEEFFNEELRIDFKESFGDNVWVKLKSVGYNNETQGGMLYLDFPDLLENEIQETEKTYLDTFLQPGVISIAPDEGSMMNASGNYHGRFTQTSDNRDFNLVLGKIHPNKTFFRVVVNARRGNNEYSNKSTLNNFSCVLEIEKGSFLT